MGAVICTREKMGSGGGKKSKDWMGRRNLRWARGGWLVGRVRDDKGAFLLGKRRYSVRLCGFLSAWSRLSVRRGVIMQ